MTATIYQTLDQHRQDPDQLLDRLIEHLRSQRRAVELFEALKMRSRHRMGLPPAAGENEPSRDDATERELEQGLIEACREVGPMLIADGQIAQGWMYLRPTGEFDIARQSLADVEIDDENYDEMIQVLLHEGVDIGRGYSAVLERQGTCNSITLFEQSLVQRPLQDRRTAGKILLDHLYAELLQAVKNDLQNKGETVDPDSDLITVLESHPKLLDGGGYHQDTTHISSTVQVAQCLDDPQSIQKAWELTQYGVRLDHRLQYPGEEPFRDLYRAYAIFFSVLQDRDREAGLRYFRQKAEQVDASEHGTGAIEAYVDLLSRTGQGEKAIDEVIRLLPEGVPPQRVVPRLLDLASELPEEPRATAFEKIARFCQQQGDLLGYAVTLHAASGNVTESA